MRDDTRGRCRADRVRAGKFTLTFFVLGLIAAAIAVARKPDGFTRANVAEELLAYFILFSIGFSYFYNFVFHVFFGELAASFIGWADSPFQAEVGYASLGFAAIGFLAFKGNCMVRFAVDPRPGDVPVGRRHRAHPGHRSPPATWRRATPA